MRTVKDPDVRKQEILDGAIRVFARKGYDKTTTSDIAGELKISQGLCYRYYPTKEAIYDAALEKYANHIVQGNLNKLDPNCSVRGLIAQMTSHMEDMKAVETEEENLYTLFHTQSSRRMHDELFLKVAKKLIPHVQAYLKAAKARGELETADPDGAAIYGVYGMVGLYLTEGLTDADRMEKMRTAWYQLLEL